MTVFWCEQVYDGTQMHGAASLMVQNGKLHSIAPSETAPPNAHVLPSGIVAPAFVDLQANGGGGVLFNENPTVEGLETIVAAHQSTGTGALLPTIITDAPQVAKDAALAVQDAIADSAGALLGLHLEGPHIATSKKGAHAAKFIRPITDEDEEFLIKTAACLPNLIVTLAPENTAPDRITRLARAGVIVSLGHSDCDYDTAMRAFDAGASMATHLFNAMSPLSSRAPGLVGAVLDHSGAYAGLIADGIHVHPATLRTALNANQGPGALVLVSDAMPPLGTDMQSFRLNRRQVLRQDGRLTLEDGTLAGADLTLARALQVMVEKVGISLVQALAMATSIPASLFRNPGDAGHLIPGAPFKAVHLTPDFTATPLGNTLEKRSFRGGS